MQIHFFIYSFLVFKNISSEPKLLLLYCINGLSSSKVLIYLGDRHVEIQLIALIKHSNKNRTQYSKGGIFIISNLTLHTSKLNSPTDFRVLSWGRFKSDGVPVC